MARKGLWAEVLAWTVMIFVLAAVLAVAAPTPQPRVDFKNFTYKSHPCVDNVPVAADIRGGTFQYYDKKMGQGFTISIAAVHYGSLAAGTRQAVVVLSCDFPMGGTATAYLYDIRGGSARLVKDVAATNWGGDSGAGPDSIHVGFAKNVLSVSTCDWTGCETRLLTRYALHGGKLLKLSFMKVHQPAPK